MTKDRCELQNLAEIFPEKVNELENAYNEWATRTNVLPFDEFLGLWHNSVKNQKK